MRRALVGWIVVAGCGSERKPVAEHREPPPVAAPARDATPADAATPPAPLDAGGPPPASLGPDGLDRGCFAWSARLRAVACVVGEQSIQGGARYAVEVLGAELPAIALVDRTGYSVDEPRIPDAAVRAVDAMLAEHGFVPSPLEARPLAPGETIEWDDPTATLRWSRTGAGREGDPRSGTWRTFADAIEIRCGERGKRFTKVMTPASRHDETPSGSVVHLPDTTLLVVTVASSHVIEGDVGSSFEAQVVDVATCAPR